MSDASVSKIMNAEGWGMPRHGKDSTFSLICLTMLVCISGYGVGMVLSLLYRGSHKCLR